MEAEGFTHRIDYFHSNNKKAIFNQFYPRIKKKTNSPVVVKMKED